MTCDQVQRWMAEHEAEDNCPAAVRLHIINCPICTAVECGMEETLAWFRSDFLPPAPDLNDKIMVALRLETEPGYEPASIKRWFLILMIFVVAMALSPFGSSFVWLQARFGQQLVIPLFLSLGLGLTIYCSCFIASHLEDLSQRWGLN